MEVLFLSYLSLFFGYLVVSFGVKGGSRGFAWWVVFTLMFSVFVRVSVGWICFIFPCFTWVFLCSPPCFGGEDEGCFLDVFRVFMLLAFCFPLVCGDFSVGYDGYGLVFSR